MDRDKIQQLINERGIKSVEEFQALINELSAQQNALGRPEFFGLSPNQMQWMLYEPFEPESPFGYWFGLAEEIQPARYLPAKTPAVVQKSEILDHLFRFPKLEVYNQ